MRKTERKRNRSLINEIVEGCENALGRSCLDLIDEVEGETLVLRKAYHLFDYLLKRFSKIKRLTYIKSVLHISKLPLS